MIKKKWIKVLSKLKLKKEILNSHLIKKKNLILI
jgi:hypothetical protein